MKIKFALQLAALALMFQLSANAQTIGINEILSSNNNANTDEDGDHEDWVELHNYGSEAVNLAGFGLTDDPAIPHKWVFPAVTMQPGSYLLIWCSDKDRTNPANPLHTNWKISASGEMITLTDAAQAVVDQSPAVQIPEDLSYGRIPNGTGNFMFFADITPGAANGDMGYSEVLPEPEFSHEGGFYTGAFTLTLTTNVPGASIIYTTDGSEPEEANIGGVTYNYKNSYPEDPGDPFGPMLTQSFATLPYSAPIDIVDRTSEPNDISMISSTMHLDPYYLPGFPIFKGTVIRAKVVKPGALSAKAISKTYFVTPEGANRFSLPVVSLSISENQLYDYEDGIYVAGVDFDNWRTANPDLQHHGIENTGNFYRRDMEHEREANFTYFVNGEQVINQNVGIRIHGGSSREWQNKSLKIYARDQYGDGDMDYAFFPGQPTNFDRLLLRNSGADFYETLFRDAFIHRLIKNLNVLIKDYQPTITFLNGEYWGILNLRDKFDNNYFKRVYNIPDGELDITANYNTVEEGDNVHWQAMYNFVSNNSMATQSNYDYITTQMDPDSFADYYISNIFFQNIDWPGNNVARWRKKVTYDANAPFGHDGRWRWLAHDLDATFATRSHNIALNSLAAATATNGPSWPNPAWSTLLLRKMLENPDFKNHFINRFADLLNTTFLTDRVIGMMDEMKSVIEPEMPEQIARWDAPTAWDWNSYLQEQVDFAQQRPVFQRDHIRSKFEIANNIDVTVDVSDADHGFVKVNTIDVKNGTDGIEGNPYPWSGIYFSNIPVTLKAVAMEGYVFSHWTGVSDSTDPEIVVTSAEAFSATAHFIPDTTPAENEPVYFWLMDNNIVNDTPLESIQATYEATGQDAVLNYESSLVGYPFTSASPFWRKASMERRNAPTPLNYIPEANNNIAFANTNMRGIQIKEPLHSGSNQNTMIFNLPTLGYRDISFAFAAMNEGTNATAIAIDYSTTAGEPQWTTAGIASNMPLTSAYQVFETDFTGIDAANHNANFKVRLRFTGSNMEVDNGNRITFNNISARATEEELSVPSIDIPGVTVYPNPVVSTMFIDGLSQEANFSIFALDGRLVKKGSVQPGQSISVDGLSRGLYLLQLKQGQAVHVKKISKK